MKRTQTLVAIALLAQQALAPWAFASTNPMQSSGQLEGFVIPSSVNANEPFTFASKGSVEGEVVEIKTVEGEVVQTKKTDRLGRVFLVGGLAAGVYLLTRLPKGGGSPVQTPIDIVNGGAGAASNALTFKSPQFVSLKDGLKLSGTGFSGNAADLSVTSGSASCPVLASTPRELQTGELSTLKPGANDFQVKNLKTGEEQSVRGAVAYRLQSKLTQQRVTNGQLTSLEFTLEPAYVQAMVKTKINSGPVHFPGGNKETELTVKNGSAKVPLLADATGSGKFNVGWDLVNMFMDPAGKPGQPNKPGDNVKGEPCPEVQHIQKPAEWKRDRKIVTDPKTGKRTTVWIAKRQLVCYMHSGCSKPKGHGGEHNFVAVKKCSEVEKYTDSNGNGKWDQNDGGWDDKNGNKKVDPGEFEDKDGNGKYDAPEPFEDKNKDKDCHTDGLEEKEFKTERERDQFIKDNR